MENRFRHDDSEAEFKLKLIVPTKMSSEKRNGKYNRVRIVSLNELAISWYHPNWNDNPKIEKLDNVLNQIATKFNLKIDRLYDGLSIKVTPKDQVLSTKEIDEIFQTFIDTHRKVRESQNSVLEELKKKELALSSFKDMTGLIRPNARERARFAFTALNPEANRDEVIKLLLQKLVILRREIHELNR